jgi:hypothetical protein
MYIDTDKLDGFSSDELLAFYRNAAKLAALRVATLRAI